MADGSAVDTGDRERRLLDAARDGDRSSIDELLRREFDHIAALCRRLCGADHDDAVQHALIAIVRGLPRFEGSARFSTWCYRVTTNACLDELRRRQRRPVPVDHREEAEVAAPRTTATDVAADRIDIDRALATLPVEFRAPVVLRDLCGLDYDEIAEVLAIPAGTVRSRIARGRRHLADQLRDSAGNQADVADVRTGDHG